VSSWISKGENMPIVGDQIKKVLGHETVAGIATKLGIAPDEAAGLRLAGIRSGSRPT
jgi:uncharacterized protein YidB (DUF937 family)